MVFSDSLGQASGIVRKKVKARWGTVMDLWVGGGVPAAGCAAARHRHLSARVECEGYWLEVATGVVPRGGGDRGAGGGPGAARAGPADGLPGWGHWRPSFVDGPDAPADPRVLLLRVVAFHS